MLQVGWAKCMLRQPWSLWSFFIVYWPRLPGHVWWGRGHGGGVGVGCCPWGKTGCCVFSVHVPCLSSFRTINERPSFACLINALVLVPPAECKRYSLISRLNLCKIAQLKAYLDFIAKQLAKENEWCIRVQFTQMNRVVHALFHQRDYFHH